MLGLILCGGKSTRMGTDKGLIKTTSLTWAQSAAEKISSLKIPLVLSVNNDQYKDYLALFDAEKLVKDDETLDISGPLAGLLSVHVKYPMEDLFVLACDMPLMEAGILQQLLNYYQQQPSTTCVFMNDGQPEPLCAIYSATGLTHTLQLLKTSQLKKHSMKYMLEQVPFLTIPLEEEQKKYFQNFNAHAALNGL